MSLKFSSIEWKSTKGIKKKKNRKNSTLINFNSSRNNILFMIYESKKESKKILKLITGKQKIKQGEIYLNSTKITNLNKKEIDACVIEPKYLDFFFIPNKFRLITFLLTNRKFLINAISKYLEAKRYYKSIKIAHDNVSLLILQEDIEIIMENFYNNVFTISEKYLDSVFDKNQQFFVLKLNNLKEDVPNKLKEAIFKYYSEKQKLNHYGARITFLQAVYDQIESFKELRFSCFCEKNSKNNHLNKKLFFFYETENSCKKYMYKINALIINYKWKIYELKKRLKKLSREIILIKEVLGIRKTMRITNMIKISQDIKEYKNFKKSQSDLGFHFKKYIDMLVDDFIPNESISCRNNLIRVIHNYHENIYSRKIEYNKNIKQIKKNHSEAGKKVVSIPNQAIKEVKKLTKQLELKMNFFKLSKKLSFIDSIKISIIKNFFLNKKLYVLNNIFNDLSLSEQRELWRSISHIIEIQHDAQFLILENNIKNIKRENSSLYFLKNNKFFYKTEDFIDKPNDYDSCLLLKNNFDNIMHGRYIAKDKKIHLKKFTIEIPTNVKISDGDKTAVFIKYSKNKDVINSNFFRKRYLKNKKSYKNNGLISTVTTLKKKSYESILVYNLKTRRLVYSD